MRAINIIRDLSTIRMGVWTAACNTSRALQSHGFESLILHRGDPDDVDLGDVEKVDVSDRSPGELIDALSLNPKEDIIVTHGPWGFQTSWGNYFSKRNFQWVHLPHGALEPWSLSHKRLKKMLYLKFVERGRMKPATLRAISLPEFENLKNSFDQEVIFIPNGTDFNTMVERESIADRPIKFLFMARLHEKKGVVELVKGWIASKLKDHSNFILNVAGPDEGEMESLKKAISASNVSNVHLLGPQYGESKVDLLKSSDFYILPSHSEGFPISVLEAVSYQMIPVLSQGCNFPELFNKNYAIEVKTTPSSVAHTFDNTNWTQEIENYPYTEVFEYLKEKYSVESIGSQLNQLYRKKLRIDE